MPRLITGVLKDYAWGIPDGLARWHGSTGAPQAELWFGTHPSGPSGVASGSDQGRSLVDFPEYQGMPLVKVLAAGMPLSIQVHPDERLAREGWADGSPLFADDAEKSEVLVALEPFDVHAGWRDASDAAAVLAGAGAPEVIVTAARDGRAVDAARALLDLDPGQRAAIESRLSDSVRRIGWPTDAVAALDRVLAAFPGDRGILVTVLLDHVRLLPGEAIAVPAGVVHSYVGGVAVEVMTSSDNVLRLGLTGKAVAVDEALGAIRADRAPQRLTGASGRPLAPSGMPFEVSVGTQPRELAAGRPRIVVALHGILRVQTDDGPDIVVPEGQGAVWARDEPTARIRPEHLAVMVEGCDVASA